MGRSEQLRDLARLLSEIRNYMGNYHVKSGVYHYYRSEFNQAVNFLRKALNDEPTLSEGDRKNARTYLTLARKGLAERLALGRDSVVLLTGGADGIGKEIAGRLQLGQEATQSLLARARRAFGEVYVTLVDGMNEHALRVKV